ncbi:hypothetical protein B0H11DRAFT_1911358 [Mycena galericulata]|nr:hypothetical protein B0H11DRAFT_1911358 [Mycena galericulata]
MYSSGVLEATIPRGIRFSREPQLGWDVPGILGDVGWDVPEVLWMYLGHPARRRRDQKFAWGFPSSQVDPWHRSPKKAAFGVVQVARGVTAGHTYNPSSGLLV